MPHRWLHELTLQVASVANLKGPQAFPPTPTLCISPQRKPLLAERSDVKDKLLMNASEVTCIIYIKLNFPPPEIINT